MNNYGKIIEISALQHAVDNAPDDKALWEKFEAALEALPREDLTLVSLATKLLEGKPYRIITDNPETVARARSFAKYLGVTVTQVGQAENETSLLFEPPEKQ